MGLKMCIKDFSALYNLKLDGECTANCVHDISDILSNCILNEDNDGHIFCILCYIITLQMIRRLHVHSKSSTQNSKQLNMLNVHV